MQNRISNKVSNKVTIQDIADELGVSRNTVSKALNNTGIISEKTKMRVLNKIKEMGYKQYIQTDSEPQNTHEPSLKEIALFMHTLPDGSHFASRLINVFQQEISPKGYRLLIYMIKDNEYETLTLPQNFNASSCAGIVCVEVFDEAYTHFLCSLDIPILFADTFANTDFKKLPAHVLYMENRYSVACVVRRLLAAGKTKIGFIGDPFHCHSFYERWLGYKDALAEVHNDSAERYAVIPNDGVALFGEKEWLAKKIQDLPDFPEVFVCGNDFYAIDAINAFSLLDISVPDDVWLVGFDNSSESRILTPPLTTISIPEDGLGHIAAALLLSKIECPDSPDCVTYVHTEPVYRESTGDLALVLDK